MLSKAIELAKKHATCPECGSGKVNADEGKVIIAPSSFKRICKCGWSIEVKG